MSIYLKSISDNGDSWPEKFIEDTDVFNKNPSEMFEFENPTFVFVYPRTEACGKTDGCDSGSWRIIIVNDKIIKNEDTGKFLGFKKILKSCLQTKPREYKRTWVMEEYRLPSKWNPKQDHVVCKIQLLFQTEIRHFDIEKGEEVLRTWIMEGIDLWKKQ
ncbi:unnamed protein product [Eruca vesicaria subsp. sativa]|uniref:NAC domain-containing protein n=1 Tax=Eruca vesicaria subsp. sativa TaxID=29727 RepID=A0ABC8LLE4_ERUVS|nr:unnamed protein product [Eruca vesicaria subsp. sativa]